MDPVLEIEAREVCDRKEWDEEETPDDAHLEALVLLPLESLPRLVHVRVDRDRHHGRRPRDAFRAHLGSRPVGRGRSGRAAPALDRGRARDIDHGLEDGARRRRAKSPARSCMGEPLYRSRQDPRCIVINEYTLFPEYCSFESPDLYFGSSSASGLGWGPGAALGAKLARPQSPVMAVVGDGAFMFSNPAAVHHASALHDLPVLFVVMNNAMWGAVQRSTLAMYPEGLASRSNEADFVQLGKLPAFEQICEFRRRLWRTRGRSGVASRSAGARNIGRKE